MALETGTYISDLVSTNPTETDPLSAGNDHFWLLKTTIKATFPNVTGAVTPTHTQLNTNFTLSTAAPNAIVPVLGFKASNALLAGTYTDIDMSLTPKGTGGVSAHIADSAASGGNKRGTYAVDWQTLRGAATQAATGTASTVIGGGNNTASGNYSVTGGVNNTASGAQSSAIGSANGATGTNSACFGGSSNLASGTGSVTIGGNANQATGIYSASISGAYGTARGVTGAVFCGDGAASTLGRSQWRQVILYCQTTDATPTVMSGTAPSAVNQFTLSNNQSAFVDGLIVAHDATNLKTASYTLRATIRRGANAAATAIIGSAVITEIDDDISIATTQTATADTTNGALAITVTGKVGTTINWSCWLRAVEASS